MIHSKIKRAVILSAMEIELAYVDEFLQVRRGWKSSTPNIYEYEDGRLQVITRIMGVGKVNAAYMTADVINEYYPHLIINVGYAGGLIRKARKGDVAIGKQYVQVDFIPYLDENRPVIAESPEDFISILEKEADKLEITTFTGKIATGDFFLHSTEKKNEIIKEYAPIAFDMESAAVAQVATKKNTPFISIRTFSDFADESALDTALDSSNGQADRIPIERRPVVLAITGLEKTVEHVKKFGSS